MEELGTATADLARLIAACRAARECRAHAGTAHARAHWHHLCGEMKRATQAYVDTLTQVHAGTTPAAIVTACRAAAECEMPTAMACAEQLRALLERDAPNGPAVVNADLARLSRLAVWARHTGADVGRTKPQRVHRRVQEALQEVEHRLRHAVLAYAHASVRGSGMRAIERARAAAADQLRADDALNAEAATPERERDLPPRRIRRRVERPLRHLRKEWHANGASSVRW